MIVPVSKGMRSSVISLVAVTSVPSGSVSKGNISLRTSARISASGVRIVYLVTQPSAGSVQVEQGWSRRYRDPRRVRPSSGGGDPTDAPSRLRAHAVDSAPFARGKVVGNRQVGMPW